jgi:hypothetical protein
MHGFLFLIKRDARIYLYGMIFLEILFGFLSELRSEMSFFLEDIHERHTRFPIHECLGQRPIEICDNVKMTFAVMGNFLYQILEMLRVWDKDIGHGKPVIKAAYNTAHLSLAEFELVLLCQVLFLLRKDVLLYQESSMP